MLLVAISEQISKLNKKEAKVLENFSKEDIKSFIDVRNFIAYDDERIIFKKTQYLLPLNININKYELLNRNKKSSHYILQ